MIDVGHHTIITSLQQSVKQSSKARSLQEAKETFSEQLPESCEEDD